MSPPADRQSLFQSWLDGHRGIVIKVARSFAPTATDAADLRQEMLLQLWLSLPNFSAQSQVSTWIYRVCLNTALTWRRGTRRRETRIEPGIDVARLPGDAATPADRAADNELLAVLYGAIQALPPAERALVLLSLDGLPYREIADITGLTENHVGVALTRARQRLATHLKGITHELE